MNTVDHDKLVISLRYWLYGKAHSDPRYNICINAMQYAMEIHTGMRKGGDFKEIYHQLTIASFLRTLIPYVKDGHRLIVLGLLHDTAEDYHYTEKYINDTFDFTYNELMLLNKYLHGDKLSDEEYYERLTGHVYPVIVKVVDRIHNLSTMHGVFDADKQHAYIDVVFDHILPMIKTTKRMNPEFEQVLELLKNVILLVAITARERLPVREMQEVVKSNERIKLQMVDGTIITCTKNQVIFENDTVMVIHVSHIHYLVHKPSMSYKYL